MFCFVVPQFQKRLQFSASRFVCLTLDLRYRCTQICTFYLKYNSVHGFLSKNCLIPMFAFMHYYLGDVKRNSLFYLLTLFYHRQFQMQLHFSLKAATQEVSLSPGLIPVGCKTTLKSIVGITAQLLSKESTLMTHMKLHVL